MYFPERIDFASSLTREERVSFSFEGNNCASLSISINVAAAWRFFWAIHVVSAETGRCALALSSFFLISNRLRYLFLLSLIDNLDRCAPQQSERAKTEIIYLLARRGLKWVRGSRSWSMVRLIEESIKRAPRSKWKWDIVDIDKTIVPFFLLIDLSTWLRQWAVAQMIRCYFTRHDSSPCNVSSNACFRFDSIHFGDVVPGSLSRKFHKFP